MKRTDWDFTIHFILKENLSEIHKSFQSERIFIGNSQFISEWKRTYRDFTIHCRLKENLREIHNSFWIESEQEGKFAIYFRVNRLQFHNSFQRSKGNSQFISKWKRTEWKFTIHFRVKENRLGFHNSYQRPKGNSQFISEWKWT